MIKDFIDSLHDYYREVGGGQGARVAGVVERGSGQPPPQGGDQGHLVMVISMMMIMMMIMTLMIGASSSQESATRVKGRMQRVVHMISVNSEQNTRLTWDRDINGTEP